MSSIRPMAFVALLLGAAFTAGVVQAGDVKGKVSGAGLKSIEHIVKSTCHVCHSSTGTNPTPQQIFEGAIPPLSALSTRVGLPAFVRKVTSGAPITMGTPPVQYRGRMPVFYYLTQDEASAAYMYLSAYPPKP